MELTIFLIILTILWALVSPIFWIKAFKLLGGIEQIPSRTELMYVCGQHPSQKKNGIWLPIFSRARSARNFFTPYNHYYWGYPGATRASNFSKGGCSGNVIAFSSEKWSVRPPMRGNSKTPGTQSDLEVRPRVPPGPRVRALVPLEGPCPRP